MDNDAACACVLDGVVEGFLADPVHAFFHCDGNIRFITHMCHHFDLVPGAQCGELFAESRYEALRFE